MSKVYTALLSVSDKTHLLHFARQLSNLGVHILSSGGTSKALLAEGIPIETIEHYTDSPEVMGGRVKTLHPRIYGGILARLTLDQDDLKKLGATPIDLVVVNLYPFKKTIADPAASWEQAIEDVDIGGPSLLRAAAKNHDRVAAVWDPEDYALILDELTQKGEINLSLRLRLATKAFSYTSAYDAAIAYYFSTKEAQKGGVSSFSFPTQLALSFERATILRYGENPHQAAALYKERSDAVGSLAQARQVNEVVKEMSFNNWVDADAALEAVREFEEAAAVLVKHTNPCGVAVRPTLAEAYLVAREADPTSAFGGIVALNRKVEKETALLLVQTFLECVIAPEFAEEALPILHSKKNLRLLQLEGWTHSSPTSLVFKSIDGGLLVQSRDVTCAGEVKKGVIVTKRQPTSAELDDLEFAWRVCKHVKSNAIVFAKEKKTVGIGAGQMSRVVSVQLACMKAGEQAKGAVLASDAFFPFPDGIHAAADVGILAIVQPGGSIKDQEVVAAADAHGLAMIFTNTRHFLHG
ncbi:bifunctional phosphoribosylaminoimidazolecarboxamide formyltransferase/IMP cyclohydrolase [Pajaroellobacter abortibovis]|uniref:Bifunctional purine biosynthesis protein PurH n=1 Tax=Pajaroellobacter abortibovis TaxID=1882918 RepID=A0A1L6MXQ5_9BACT|nr:bifunctional phosphoribosylaminoimidazolecarboxamide formyltransferase/IMP cyclohydrolase [Pajaroellobacter abortibovis]APS00225.1 bifunctional phosphoribosylaminoimidazolecarboxamide formyltransferase/IMP cyclohydrolase [Pajaroellobacter abortibovis]